jgi:hypothetical protein
MEVQSLSEAHQPGWTIEVKVSDTESVYESFTLWAPRPEGDRPARRYWAFSWDRFRVEEEESDYGPASVVLTEGYRRADTFEEVMELPYTGTTDIEAVKQRFVREVAGL